MVRKKSTQKNGGELNSTYEMHFAMPEQKHMKEQTNKKKGPPNRMNDLNYSTWMKFQKSFFHWKGLRAFTHECVRFFTKAEWPDGRNGSILLVGDSELEEAANKINPPRQVTFRFAESLENSVDVLSNEPDRTYDFVMLALNEDKNAVFDSYIDQAATISQSITRIMREEKYFCVILPPMAPDCAVLPLAWNWATAARGICRLRDEKVGLLEVQEPPVYCLFFQAIQDGLESRKLVRGGLQLSDQDSETPHWVIPKPPPRKPGEVLHPAKFPETLVRQFIKHFSEPGHVVFDPMAGTGSAVIAANECGRDGVGIELSEEFVAIANNRVAAHGMPLFAASVSLKGKIIHGDARDSFALVSELYPKVDYCITSPPYWSMLQNRGSEGQRGRREKGLRTTYSESTIDVGNIDDYAAFLNVLDRIYSDVAKLLPQRGVITIIVKNVKRNHVIYPLGWDLVYLLARTGGPFLFKGCTLWCQDDIGLKPFAVGTHWVSNTLHQYCLHFEKA